MRASAAPRSPSAPRDRDPPHVATTPTLSMPLGPHEGEPWEEDVTNVADTDAQRQELLPLTSPRGLPGSPMAKHSPTRTSMSVTRRALPGSLLAAARGSSPRPAQANQLQEETRAELRNHSQILRRIEGLFVSELQACRDAMLEALSATRKELTSEIVETCRATIQEEASKLRDEAVQLEAQTSRVAAIVGHLNEDVHKLVETPRAPAAGPPRVSEVTKQRLFARLDEALKSEAFARKESTVTVTLPPRETREKEPQSSVIVRDKAPKAQADKDLLQNMAAQVQQIQQHETQSPLIVREKGPMRPCPKRCDTQSARTLGGSVRVEGGRFRLQPQQQQPLPQTQPQPQAQAQSPVRPSRDLVDQVVSPGGMHEAPLTCRRQSPERRGYGGSVDLHGPHGRIATTPKVASKATYIPTTTPPLPPDPLACGTPGVRYR